MEDGMSIADLYRSVTARIVADLDAGIAPWVKPWKDGRTAGLLPQNAVTGRPYRGINIPILWDAANRAGYPRQEWLTFKQAFGAGGVVRKGERGTPVVFVKRVLAPGKDDDETDALVSLLRVFTVFNVEQVDGLAPEPTAAEPVQAPILVAEAFVRRIGADIRHGGNVACYVPSQDLIALPEPRQFESAAHYFATALHELTHWTGHQERLNRQLSHRFGSQAYAAEELVAELGAAFLCAELGIEGRLRHTDYIGAWLKLLRDDAKAVFTAASKASQAADFLRTASQPACQEER